MAKKKRGNGIDPNAGLSSEKDMGAAMQEMNQEELSEALQERRETAMRDRQFDESMSMSEADAKRATPRPRTDNLDERYARRIEADNVIRRNPSSRLKKRLSKQKNQVLAKQPPARAKVMQGMLADKARLESLNEVLAAARGNIDDLGPNAYQSARRLDRMISDYERENVGVATVYAPIEVPAGMTNNDLAERFERMAAQKTPMTFDRYVIADHSINQASAAAAPASVDNGAPLVFEYETSRGMYVGGSDTVDNGMHLIARSNSVDILGVKTVTVQRKDGTTYDQRVVQIRDNVDPDLRTTAKH